MHIPSNAHHETDDENIEYALFPSRGQNSVERDNINLHCQKILSVTYFRDSEIPPCPSIGNSQMFSFTDETIPKMENLKRYYNPDKPNPNAEIFEFIDNLSESKLTPEIIQTITQKIQNKDFTPEEKTKILDYLKKHLDSKGNLRLII